MKSQVSKVRRFTVKSRHDSLLHDMHVQSNEEARLFTVVDCEKSDDIFHNLPMKSKSHTFHSRLFTVVWSGLNMEEEKIVLPDASGRAIVVAEAGHSAEELLPC